MYSQTCHCNGSSGTDCHYCGGSGYVNNEVRKILIVPLVKPKPIDEPKKVIKTVEPIVSKPRKKSFDERILELSSSLRETGKNAPEETIIYLGRKIRTLYESIKTVEGKVKTKQERHFKSILSKSKELIFDYDNKFPDYRLVESRRIINTLPSKKSTVPSKVKRSFR